MIIFSENDGGGGGEALWGTIKYFTVKSATYEVARLLFQLYVLT